MLTVDQFPRSRGVRIAAKRELTSSNPNPRLAGTLCAILFTLGTAIPIPLASLLALDLARRSCFLFSRSSGVSSSRRPRLSSLSLPNMGEEAKRAVGGGLSECDRLPEGRSFDGDEREGGKVGEGGAGVGMGVMPRNAEREDNGRAVVE